MMGLSFSRGVELQKDFWAWGQGGPPARATRGRKALARLRKFGVGVGVAGARSVALMPEVSTWDGKRKGDRMR